ncbi:MAG TPA: alpha-ketoglutarate-dependent dioxygenase AlkB [Pyrinomonadaceae bacterium]|nr:alpha-ketoglutarate-dependent dioxygenase AlkB [Pyrinomonadaceae bacterium]
MTRQLNFLTSANSANEEARQSLEGFRYQPELISVAEEAALLTRVRVLPFKNFEFHGFKGKRRTVSFGWQYEFSGRGALRKADDIPEFLLPLRARAAAFAGIAPEAFQHVLVIEYGPGAGIGWHRDRPVFGNVIGVSLVAPCVLRFRRKVFLSTSGRRVRGQGAQRGSRGMWQRVNVHAEPRSAYFLSGPARSEWEHSILRVDELRYSITFRNVLEIERTPAA